MANVIHALLLLSCVILPVVSLVLLAERFGYVRTACVTVAVITLLLVAGISFLILTGGMYAVGP